MNIAALVEAENHVCCRYRIAAFRPYWEAAGHTLTILPLGKGFGERWKTFEAVRDFDCVILQRKLLSRWELGRLRKRAKRLIFDFDDAIWLRDSYSAKGFVSPKHSRRFARTIKWADFAVVGNRFLREQAGRFVKEANIVEIPTYVEPNKYALATHDRPPGEAKLVWLGSSSTLQGIEQQSEMFDAVAEALPGVRFKVICDRFPKFGKMPVEEVPWNEATEAAELADCDIGIGWVPDDPWSHGKCGLKLLQYQAAGLAVVANPVGVQADIVRHGETGLLADSPEEWLRGIAELVHNPALRRRLGEAGRANILAHYTVETGAPPVARTSGPHLSTMFSHILRKILPFKLPERVVLARAGGRTWHMLPAAVELFGEQGPDLDSWKSTAVKENLQRTITRVVLPGGTVYVKRCRVNTPRAWVREMARPVKARLEFENAVVLRAKGIDCIEPLAWGETASAWPGETIIITREQPNAILLEEILQTVMPLPVRRELTRSFAVFLAKMHNAGVSHPDPHPGNFLVEMAATPKFALLDVHGVRFGKPVTWRAAADNLVLVNRWFQLRSERTDRARFWKAYASHRHGLSDARARDVETLTVESNREFWSARDARYLGNNRQFRKFLHGHAVRDLPVEAVQEWFADPEVAFRQPATVILKDSASTTVAEVRFGDQTVIVKRFKLKKSFAVLRNLLRTAPARRSWLNGQHLLDRQIPTARPLAYCYRKCYGIEAEGYVAFEKVPDACNLVEAVEQGEVDAEQIGQLLRTMHDRDVRHRDLKATNILISRGAPVLIDLVGVSVSQRVNVAARQLDLARLAVSFLGHSQVRNSDRLRFLQTYLRWAPASWGNWKVWWKCIAIHAREKVARNERTGRPLT